MVVAISSRRLSVRTSKVLIGLFSSIISFCTVALLGEAFVRLTRPYMTPDTLGDKSLDYQATVISRNAFPQRVQTGSQRHMAGIALINSRGYRGQEFDVPKPSNTIRIVVLGGSAAFDIYADVGKDWPKLAEIQLHESGQSNVEIINAATPGHATWDSLGKLYGEIWMFEPDYIIVVHAWNDIKYFRWLSSDKSLLRGFPPLPVVPGDPNRIVWNPFTQYTGNADQFLSGHSQLYVRLRWRYMSWRLGLLNRTIEGGGRLEDTEHYDESEYYDSFSDWGIKQYKLNLRLIADTARDIGAEPIFLTQPRLVSEKNGPAERERIAYEGALLTHDALVRAFEETDDAILHAAQIEDVPVLDLSSLNGKTGLYRDHVHTTARGSQIIAEAVANFLSKVLEDDNQ